MNFARRSQAMVDVVKRGGDQPPWWNLGTVVIGLIFVAVFGWTLISDISADPPLAAPAAPGGSAPLPGSTTTAPENPDPSLAPSGTPVPTPVTDATMQVSTTFGQKVAIPVAAVQVAQQALRGLYDPALAAQVPVADGVTFPVPASVNTAAELAPLKVSIAGAAEVTFVASADPDGAGQQPEVFHTLTVARDGDEWVFTGQG